MAVCCNIIFKSISIYCSSYQSISLVHINSRMLANSPFSRILSEESDGMSSSNTIINHHSPISLCLSYWNYHLLWVESVQGDLINQSLSLILFIISSFDSAVYSLPLRTWYPRMMDWSWVRSHSFSHSIIHTLKYYWMTLIECLTSHFNSNERMKTGEIEWFFLSSKSPLNGNRLNFIRNLFQLICNWYP